MPGLSSLPSTLRYKIWLMTESLIPTLFYPEEIKFIPIDNVSDSEHWQQNLVRVHHGRILFDTQGKYLPQPAITRVNQEMRKETLEIYYAHANFYVSRYFGMQSGELSHRYVLKWVEMQCDRLIFPGSVLFSRDFDRMAVAKAKRILATGVVCRPIGALKARETSTGDDSDWSIEEGEDDEDGFEDTSGGVALARPSEE